MDDAARKILFTGEAQLTAWGESSTTGAWVKMWVHPDDLEAFKLMKLRVGRTAGQRLGVAIVQIGDDEAIVEHRDGQGEAAPAPAPAPAPTPAPPPRRNAYTPNIGALGMLAVRWCQDRDFWRWASQQGIGLVDSQDRAKEYVLEVCDVYDRHGQEASRKHLDTDPECAQRFHDMVRIPYRDWLAEQGIEA